MYSRKVGNQYDKLRWKTMSGRQVEGAVLEKAALQLRRAQANLEDGVLSDEADEAIAFNKRVWDVLRSGWLRQDCALPDQIRGNLINLAVYMAKAELAFRADPTAARLAGMIQVNESLATGLGVTEQAGAMA
ncbi:MAG: flagellar biosynthesis regulator FlaF [Verrucomicrobiota bacterium]